MKSVSVLALLLVLPAWSLPEDWPQFRGPGRDGVRAETGVMRTMPEGGWPILWRQPVQYGWASPVVAKGDVFVFDAELLPPKARERVHCFDAATGKSRWIFEYEAKYQDWVFIPPQQSGPSATPIVENNRLYCVGACGDVHCLDTATGKILWNNHLAERYTIEAMQCRSSPLLEGGLLILLVGGKPDACLVALDKMTGVEVWHALEDSVSNSSPITITAGGERQLIAWTGDSVTALNPQTGAILWTLPMTTSNNDNIATPVAERGYLLISGLMLYLDGATPAARQLWPEGLIVTKRILSNTCSPCLRGEYVYAARSRGELVCLKSASGEVVWETGGVTEIKSAASIHLFPNGGDTFFLFNDQGELILATLSPSGYREIGRSKLLEPTSPFSGHRVWVPPAFARGHVFARNDKEVVCASLALVP